VHGETIARSCPSFYAGNVLKEKKDERDSTRPDFWSLRYASDRTPWKMDRLPKRLEAFVRSLPSGSCILVPGCGDDHRAIEAFARTGHRVTAIDFSSTAVSRAQQALPQLSDRTILGDFFSHDLGTAVFDFVYERTFLCSLPPRLWNDYVARVAQLLRPRGTLAGFFLYGTESDPPPYPLTESEAAEIFDGHFDLIRTEPVADSLSIFAGKEKWQEWQLRS
jgi:hypothetical protein